MADTPLFQRKIRDGVLVVTPVRSISSLSDSQVLQELDLVMQEYVVQQPCGVLLDFSNVDYFGSSMLEGLRSIWNQVRQSSGRMGLCCVSQVGAEILKLSRFDTLWPVSATLEEGLRNIKQA